MLWNRLGSWGRYDGSIDLLTLTFIDEGVERGYAHSRRQRLAQMLRNVCIAAIVAGGLVMMLNSYWNTAQYATADAYLVSRIQLAIYLSYMSYCIGVVVVSSSSRMVSKLGTLGLERLVVFSAFLYLCMTSVCYKHYLAKMVRYGESSATLGVSSLSLANTDAVHILYLHLCVTVVHIMTPVRWCLLLPIEILATFFYLVPAVYFESPVLHGVAQNAAGLLCLAFLTAWGKRASEYQDRRMYESFLGEKQLRFRAEFELSNTRCDKPANDDQLSSRESRQSRPSTTATGRAFASDVSCEVDLHHIQYVGLREQWLIEKDELMEAPEDVLGVGGFGSVFAGKYQGTPVALKAARTTASLTQLCNELRIMRRLRHPHIVFLYGACLEDVNGHVSSFKLVLELVDGVTLKNFVLDRHATGCEVAKQKRDLMHACADISRALVYLHSRHPCVVHGDLKHTNVYIEQRFSAKHSYRAKLLDFGLSRLLTRNARPLGGTLRWSAPEIVRQNAAPGTAADIYSFGCLVFFVMSGLVPFQSMKPERIAKKLLNAQGCVLEWPEGTRGGPFRSVVLSCCRADLATRPAIRDVHSSIEAAIYREEAASEAKSAAARFDDRVNVMRDSNESHIEGLRHIDLENAVLPQPVGHNAGNHGVVDQVRFPHYRPTSSTSISNQLLSLMVSMNVPLQERICCHLHASLRALSIIINDMIKSPNCAKFKGEAFMVQCRQCTLLTYMHVEVDPSCRWCGCTDIGRGRIGL
eukprot:TRINITY_DN28077_c0_g5_i1.p1 TRINITY_DN28077_c0_g5~~TRINITY_DN28077_c0_g5_i1.p1  ORF type:complete len:752 (+),score=35.28 TRINITY_DN28077_c0_g5_i1:55-2310(+)